MNFPFIPVRPIIAEVMSDVSKLIKNVNKDEEDLYIHAADAMRMIGGNHYPNETVYLTIKKYTAALPRNFYLFEDIFLCSVVISENVEPYTPKVKPNGNNYRRLGRLRPADTNTIRLRACSDKEVYESKITDQTFVIKTPPGVIRTSMKDAVIELDYLALPSAEDGELLIQDEINTILTIKNYLFMCLIREPYLMGEVRGDVFQSTKAEYEDHLLLAQQNQKFFDLWDTREKLHERETKYSRFRLR